MTKFEAICALIDEAYRDRTTISGYKRLLRAIKVLEFTIEEASAVLHKLDYTNQDGTTYGWLTRKLRESK